jgi:hypothetical protein
MSLLNGLNNLAAQGGHFLAVQGSIKSSKAQTKG